MAITKPALGANAQTARVTDTFSGADSSSDGRWRCATIHLCGLMVLAIGVVLLQRFHGLLALTLPLGPALLAKALARGPRATLHRDNALCFSLIAAVVICLAWFGVQLALSPGWFALTFPVFLLLLLFSLTNYAVMSLVAATKAYHGSVFSYPWVPEALLRRSTRPQEGQLDGNR